MTLKWTEGAEVWADSDYFERAYQSGGAGMSTLANPRVPPGVRCLSNSSVGNLLVTPSLGVQNTWIVGFGLNASSDDDTMWSFRLSATEQCRIDRIDQGSGIYKLALYRGATQVAITTETFDSSLWHHFEFKVTVRTSTNGAYELRHNQSALASMTGTGVNLADSGSDGCDVHAFAGEGRTDDVHICDDQGSNNNDFLGDSVVFEVAVDSDGDVTDWTTSTGSDHSALVDDEATAPSDSDYISSDTNGQKDLFEMLAMPGTGLGAIFGVAVVVGARMEAIGSRTLKPVYRNLANTEGDGDNFSVSGTAVSEFLNIMELNPVSGVAWTKSDIDDGQFGVAVVS